MPIKPGGCGKCRARLSGESNAATWEHMMEKAKKFNKAFDTTDYSLAKPLYKSGQTPLPLICKVVGKDGQQHGQYTMNMEHHTNGIYAQGCRKCADQVTRDRRTIPWINEQLALKIGPHITLISREEETTFCKGVFQCSKHNSNFTQNITNALYQGTNGCYKCVLTNQSKPAAEWLDECEQFLGRKLVRKETGGEFHIPTTRYHADGYDPITNTIYEFHGDYWHGNVELFNSNAINPTTGFTFGYMYSRTIKRQDKIKSLGYNLVVMWEHDFKKGCSQLPTNIKHEMP